MVELPHFASPFVINKMGAAVVEQASPEDITDCVYRTAVCSEGFREDSPEFGIPDVSFATVPLPIGAIETALARWEPRANLEIEEQAEALDQAIRDVIIEVS